MAAMNTSLLLASVCSIVAAPIAAQFPITGEIRVHAVSEGSEEQPSVAMDKQGRTIVTWSGSEERIWARLFSEQGLPSSDAVVLSSNVAAFRTNPRISLVRDGRGFAAWSSSQELGLGLAGPFGVCLSVEGPIATCPVFALPTGDRLLNGGGPAVAASSSGEGSALWFSLGSQTQSDRLIGGAFNGDGVATASNFVVEPQYLFSSSAAGHWRVASLKGSRIVAVWSKDFGGVRGHDIVARLFSTDGTPLSGEIPVATATTGDQVVPDVASDSDGNFAVVWEDRSIEADGSGVYGQRFGPHGELLGSQFRVSSDVDSAQFSPAIAMDSSGTFVVAFTSVGENPESFLDIFARAFRSNGTSIGSQIWVTEGTPVTEEQDLPALALSDAGAFVVAYESFRCEDGHCGKDVLARWFNLPCEESATILCLNGGRFRARTYWGTADGRQGLGLSVPLTEDTGGFSFFAPGIFEVLVKLVNGCTYNDNFWMFAGALSNVSIELLVQDSWTGAFAMARNELGTSFVPYQSIDAFSTCSASKPLAPTEAPSTPVQGDIGEGSGSSSGLELLGGRFLVSARWHDFEGHSGDAVPQAYSDESGFLYFFGPENIELAVKVLDACSYNSSFWVYSAGLTNLRVELEVLDLETLELWQYENPLGAPYPAVLDSSAFDTCLAN